MPEAWSKHLEEEMDFRIRYNIRIALLSPPVHACPQAEMKGSIAAGFTLFLGPFFILFFNQFNPKWLSCNGGSLVMVHHS